MPIPADAFLIGPLFAFLMLHAMEVTTHREILCDIRETKADNNSGGAN